MVVFSLKCIGGWARISFKGHLTVASSSPAPLPYQSRSTVAAALRQALSKVLLSSGLFLDGLTT